MRSEFAIGTRNNRVWMEFHPDAPADEWLQRQLSALDGHERASFILAPLPAGKPWPDVVDPWNELEVYMQAGGSSNRMTIEVRRKAGDDFDQLVVGRTVSGPPSKEPTTVIEWDDYAVTVRENEVFTAGEAIHLFSSYLDSEDLPAGYTCRPLAL
jgi:hypothetical protein